MKIQVDFERCSGLGICESLAPRHFEVSVSGNLDLLQADVTATEQNDVEDAVASCPNGALSLVD